MSKENVASPPPKEKGKCRSVQQVSAGAKGGRGGRGRHPRHAPRPRFRDETRSRARRPSRHFWLSRGWGHGCVRRGHGPMFHLRHCHADSLERNDTGLVGARARSLDGAASPVGSRAPVRQFLVFFCKPLYIHVHFNMCMCTACVCVQCMCMCIFKCMCICTCMRMCKCISI